MERDSNDVITLLKACDLRARLLIDAVGLVLGQTRQSNLQAEAPSQATLPERRCFCFLALTLVSCRTQAAELNALRLSDFFAARRPQIE